MKRYIITIINIFLFISITYAEERIIYIKPFSVVGSVSLSPAIGMHAKDYITEVILSKGGYIIISDEEVTKVLEHEQIKMLVDTCDDDSCMKKMMEKIDADYILYGNISKEKNNFIITTKLLDRRTGSLSKLKTLEVSEETMLKPAFRDIGLFLAFNIDFDDSKYKSKHQDTDIKKSDKYKYLSLPEQRLNGFKAMGLSAVIPGSGQYMYGGEYSKIESTFFFTGFILLTYLTYDAYKAKKDAQEEYDSLGTGASESEFDKKWNKLESENKRYNYFTFSLISFYLLNIADAYYSASSVEKVELQSEKTTLKSGFNLNFCNDAQQNYFGISYVFIY